MFLPASFSIPEVQPRRIRRFFWPAGIRGLEGKKTSEEVPVVE